jgi:rfaE bifunctional protein kinase chain/domain
MIQARLNQLLAEFARQRILVVGDFFLDYYLLLDRSLSEPSLETGLEAYQVVGKRASPGAAGTVVNNLRALGVQVTALGVIGADGEGYELKKALAAQAVNIDSLLESDARFTPTYTKPMMQEADGHSHELNRLDIKNRRPMPADIQDQIINRLKALTPTVDGIIVADQVSEADCGVITERVRTALAELGQTDRPFIAVDSRERIGLFRQVIVKPNSREALMAVGQEVISESKIDSGAAAAAGQQLFERTGKTVVVTRGPEGALVIDQSGVEHVPGFRVDGPIDIVGAGDSMMAGLMTALCSGATPAEAAWVGNAVASITVQQIGTTGTASPEQLSQLGE